MSRIVTIKGNVKIQNVDLAKEALKEAGVKNIQIKDNQFIFSGYDYYDGVNKDKDIQKVEEIYLKKFNEYLKKLEEKEKKRIEEEKRKIREEKYKIIIENAKKQGYKIKKEIRKDNTIKLILQKRVY